MKSKYPLKSGQLTDKIALREEDNVFIGQNEFVEPIVVADPVDVRDAVNKGYVDDRVKFARYRWTNPYKFDGTINFPTEIFNYNLDVTRTNNNERIYVEEGYYNVNVTLEFEQNGQNFI